MWRLLGIAWACAACGNDEPVCSLEASCGVLGARCVADSQCGAALGCNQGALPEDLGAGACLPPAAEGEACGFNHAPVETLQRALEADYAGIDRGDCAVGLWCEPLFPLPGSAEAPPECDDMKGVPCFFSGACRAAGVLALGAPCAASEACTSGVCAVFAEPLSVVPMVGFDDSGRWLGPHVGRCIGAGDAIAECERGVACPAGFTCIERVCVPPHTLRPGAFCSEEGGDECAFGLACSDHSCRH